MLDKVLASNVKATLTQAGNGIDLAKDILGNDWVYGPAIEGTWAVTEGGELTRERENSWNGGEFYDIMVGKVTGSDITLTRPYRHAADDGWITQLRRAMYDGYPCYYNVDKQNYRFGNQAVGKKETHLNCPVLTVRTFQAVAGPEASAVTVEIVVATQGPAKPSLLEGLGG